MEWSGVVGWEWEWGRQETREMRNSRKTFVHAEKKAKSCAQTLLYTLLALATLWALGCVWHVESQGAATVTVSSVVSSADYTKEQSGSRTPSSASSGNIDSTLGGIGKERPAPDVHVSRDPVNHNINNDKKMNKVENSASAEMMEDHSNIHVVFSTDCSKFQDWQSLLLFHSASVVKQPGTITRVASGCTDNKANELRALYKTLHPTYNVHFTPDFKTDAKTKKKYDFYNKPFGILHWLEHADPPLQSNALLALIDPDFIFLRPLTSRVAGQDNTLVSDGVTGTDLIERAGRGHPVAQYYGKCSLSYLLSIYVLKGFVSPRAWSSLGPQEE